MDLNAFALEELSFFDSYVSEGLFGHLGRRIPKDRL
jgi:hypothetical protein